MPDYDELVVIANKSRLASDTAYRTVVREFLAGLAKGSAAAQANPDAAFAALAPAVLGPAYSSSLLRQMIAATAPLLANRNGFGAMSAMAWQSFATWMYHAGLLAQPVNIASAGIVNTTLLSGA